MKSLFLPTFLLLATLCSASVSQAAKFECFTLCLREDTAGAAEILRNGLRSRAQDDHLTFSLLTGLEFHALHRVWQLQGDLDVLTNRQAGYRSDLITLLLGSEFRLGQIELILGIGVLGHGSLGGAEIQNAYHRLRGHRPMDLAEPSSTSLAPALQAQILWSFSHIRKMNPRFGTQVFIAPGGGLQRLHLTANVESRFSRRVTWSASLGGSWFWLDSDLAHAYHSSPDSGLLLHIQLNNQAGLAAWACPGLTRRDQTLVGLTLTIGQARAGRLLSWLAQAP